MITKMFKSLSQFFGAIFYAEEPMTPEQEEYNRLMQEREQMVHNTVKKILEDIERVCRQDNSITVTQHGFDQVSPVLYEDSLHEKIVLRLQALGYRCRMNFDYENGKLYSSLTISWWGLDK